MRIIKQWFYDYRYWIITFLTFWAGMALIMTMYGCVPESYCVRKSRIAHERWEDKGYLVRYQYGWRSEMDKKRHSLGLLKEKHRWTEVWIDGKFLVLDDGKPPRGTAKEMGYVG